MPLAPLALHPPGSGSVIGGDTGDADAPNILDSSEGCGAADTPVAETNNGLASATSDRRVVAGSSADATPRRARAARDAISSCGEGRGHWPRHRKTS